MSENFSPREIVLKQLIQYDKKSKKFRKHRGHCKCNRTNLREQDLNFGFFGCPCTEFNLDEKLAEILNLDIVLRYEIKTGRGDSTNLFHTTIKMTDFTPEKIYKSYVNYIKNPIKNTLLIAYPPESRVNGYTIERCIWSVVNILLGHPFYCGIFYQHIDVRKISNYIVPFRDIIKEDELINIIKKELKMYGYNPTEDSGLTSTW